LETLDIRVERQCQNAAAVAEFLEGRKGVGKVLYPGLKSHPQHDLAMAQMSDGSTIVSFEIDGGKDAAFTFLNALGLIDISNNLGDAKSLTTHPATTTHQRLSEEERQELNITDGLVRLSVGLEDAEDIKEDLDQALSAAEKK
jgi:O-succinylhomoserine sulfhydrylase